MLGAELERKSAKHDWYVIKEASFCAMDAAVDPRH